LKYYLYGLFNRVDRVTFEKITSSIPSLIMVEDNV